MLTRMPKYNFGTPQIGVLKFHFSKRVSVNVNLILPVFGLLGFEVILE